MEVDGSRGERYAVTILNPDREGIELGCSCPHFDEGHFCKHLWAAALVADEQGLFGGSVAVSAKSKTKKKKPAPSAWQKQLKRQGDYLPNSTPPLDAQRPRRVFYLLEAAQSEDTPVVCLHQQQTRKDGEWGAVKPLAINHDAINELDDEQDRAALGTLFGARRQATGYEAAVYSYSSYEARTATRVEVGPQLFTAVLPKLAATGRFVWLLTGEQGFDDARPIAWDGGPAWRFRLRAEAFDRRRKWRLTGELVQEGKPRGEEVRPVGAAVRCFASGLLLLDDRLGLLETPADYRWVEALRASEELIVNKGEREELLEELWRTGDGVELVGEDALRPPHVVGEPVGRLMVHTPEETPVAWRSRNTPLYASVAYRYGEHEARLNSSGGAWLTEGGDQLTLRNLPAEASLLGRLRELGLEPKAVSYNGNTSPGHLEFPSSKLNHVVETLVDEGWVVEAEGVRVRRSGVVSVSVASGVDWFDLDGGADFDGERVALPELLAALRAGERYVELSDGSRGMLPEAWLERFAPLADLATRGEQGALRFQPSQALLLDLLLAARESDTAIELDRQFVAWRKRLASFSGVKPVAAPRSFRGELRDYQREGLAWLRFLEKFGLGGCLADDMGLGKTIQVLALLAERRRRQPKQADRRPSLVVAPKSLVHNWRLEAERFTPRLAVAEYTGVDRRERINHFGDYDLVLTTYGTLRQDAAELSETKWDYAILDEAQAIKNPASQSAMASRLLDARHRLALSGTRIENQLGELWSIFEFLNPGLLGKSQSLAKLAKNGCEADGAKLDALRRGLAPFLLRRTKQQVLPQLPKKTEQHLYCELPPVERKRYNEIRDHYRASLSEKINKSSLAKAKIHVLEALLRLRQAACHPGLIDKRQKSKPSAKLSLLVEQLAEVVAEGHKALVFSQFTTMLDIVRDRLDKAGVVYEYLDGKTRNRQARVERFQSDDACQAFLISLKAGGCGLNLTAADYVFLLDPWWNPAVESQAIDRAHRLGQSRPVFAYRLIARNTVEEKILELQASKRGLAEAIVSADSSLLKSLTAEDLQRLLS